jgi:hypothetical protein
MIGEFYRLLSLLIVFTALFAYINLTSKSGNNVIFTNNSITLLITLTVIFIPEPGVYAL